MKPSISVLPAAWLTRLLGAACLLLALALPLWTARALWVLPPEGWLAGVGVTAPLALAAWQKGFAMVLGLLPVGAMAYGLIRARQCLQGLLRQEVFALPTVRHLRGFAVAVFSSAALGLTVPMLISVVLTWHAPAEHGALALQISSSDLLLGLVAGVLWQIAAVFMRAVALADDHAQIV